MTALFPYLFVVLICSVIGWFFLVHTLFKTLRLRHPEKYEEMGSPILFSMQKPNSMSELWLFTKFLFKREWRELNDTKLARLSWIMLIYLITYASGFIFLQVLLFKGYAP